MRPLAWALLLCVCCGCTGAPATRSAPASAPAAGRAPFDASPAAGNATIDISIDPRAAREILQSLARPRMEMSDVKVLEDLPPVRDVIRDSTRTPESFERDFAAAFESEVHAAVFDFRSVRERRERWQALLDAIVVRQADLVRLSQRRAASLLPSDAALSVRLRVDFSFALPGLEDHLVIRNPEGPELVVIDFARALADFESGPLDAQISSLSRLIAGEAFGQAWDAYREGSPAWKRADPRLGELEPLLKIVAAAAPVGLFSIDESFFPLSAWLKDPMKRAVDDLNRRAERIAHAQGNLEERVEITSEIRRASFVRQIAGPIGAFLADAIVQDSGVAGLRAAVREGPRSFFAAYDRATQKDKTLVPLAQPIRDKLK